MNKDVGKMKQRLQLFRLGKIKYVITLSDLQYQRLSTWLAREK